MASSNDFDDCIPLLSDETVYPSFSNNSDTSGIPNDEPEAENSPPIRSNVIPPNPLDPTSTQDVFENQQSQHVKVEVKVKLPKPQPQWPKLSCSDCQKQFRGEHELNRHKANHHTTHRKVYVCIDSSEQGNLLANCKPCATGRQYSAYYNAAAHLRRAHFHPRTKGRKIRASEERQPRLNKYNDPPMDVLRKNWIEEIEVTIAEFEARNLYREDGRESQQTSAKVEPEAVHDFEDNNGHTELAIDSKAYTYGLESLLIDPYNTSQAPFNDLATNPSTTALYDINPYETSPSMTVPDDSSLDTDLFFSSNETVESSAAPADYIPNASTPFYDPVITSYTEVTTYSPTYTTYADSNTVPMIRPASPSPSASSHKYRPSSTLDSVGPRRKLAYGDDWNAPRVRRVSASLSSSSVSLSRDALLQSTPHKLHERAVTSRPAGHVYVTDAGGGNAVLVNCSDGRIVWWMSS